MKNTLVTGQDKLESEKPVVKDTGSEYGYRLFGVNAELLIDHTWGWEPCTIVGIKACKPGNNSVGSGQVLQCSVSLFL